MIGSWRRMLTAPFVLVLAALLLQGCAATGPKGLDMASRMNEIPPGYGRIVFFRSDSLVGAAVQPAIRIGGQVVGQSRPGGFFYVDAAPGKHSASVSTEATSTLDIHVVAGQTHYVRSAVSFGVVVGRVTLSVEGVVTAKGEVQSLSYTGAQVSRIGNVDAAAPAGAPTTTAMTQQAPPLKRGDRVVYRITDGMTKISREETIAVDRIEGDRIHFLPGGRVETTRGAVEKLGAAVAGEMDACSPPSGWGPPPGMALGMRWTQRFHKPADTRDCGGSIELEAQMVSEEVMPTAVGNYMIQRIEYKGVGSRGGFVYSFETKVWYSPALGRVVKFESVRTAVSGIFNTSAVREAAELVDIRRD